MPFFGVAAWAACAAWLVAAVPFADRVAEIRVQGNYRTTEADVLKLAVIQIGDPLTPETVNAVAERLRKSGKFDEVDVRQRWRTLEPSGDATLMILLREKPGGPGLKGQLAYAATHPMVLPMLTWEDGYGMTYGGRVSPANLLGKNAHVSFPFTWGGTKQAAVEISRPFKSGPLTRVLVTGALSARENPFYEVDDNRQSGSVRLERSFGRAVRAGGGASVNAVRFDTADAQGSPAFGQDERQAMTIWGGDITLDTRASPDVARNDVFVSAGYERLEFSNASIGRYRLDARGYVGLPFGATVAVRGFRGDADRSLPLVERYLLGGTTDPASLRGFEAGFATGDTVVTASIEFRQPLTSPLSFGSIGAKFFADTGTAYDDGHRLSEAHFDTGVGGGLFFNAAFLNFTLDVARGLDHGWRAHVMAGLTF
jgi:outer membrane protein assembly factor BamA